MTSWGRLLHRRNIQMLAGDRLDYGMAFSVIENAGTEGTPSERMTQLHAIFAELPLSQRKELDFR